MAKTPLPARETRALPGISRPCRLSYQFVDRDRQITYAFTGRVINSVCDCGGRAGDSDVTHAVRAHRIKRVIRFTDEMNIDRVNIGMHGHVIIGEISRSRQSGWLNSGGYLAVPVTFSRPSTRLTGLLMA